ncbi:hypothetical protein BCV70DRAFT_84482 [Testicularia cyperi]|uniref:Uncharacterized protein n=1 Tax=Testicularia cyperi TaxID=1882483 RepID=A0A317XS23_9BASI|nr:hypothetical protein BCV70DRAFT_84482 [Testicularia cyperi]
MQHVGCARVPPTSVESASCASHPLHTPTAQSALHPCIVSSVRSALSLCRTEPTGIASSHTIVVCEASIRLVSLRHCRPCTLGRYSAQVATRILPIPMAHCIRLCSNLAGIAADWLYQLLVGSATTSVPKPEHSKSLCAQCQALVDGLGRHLSELTCTVLSTNACGRLLACPKPQAASTIVSQRAFVVPTTGRLVGCVTGRLRPRLILCERRDSLEQVYRPEAKLRGAILCLLAGPSGAPGKLRIDRRLASLSLGCCSCRGSRLRPLCV